jgi:alkylated DNA repair dioxygenase AlkB
MEEACKYIEEVVNQELRKRKRYALEWADSEWRANVAAVNCYNGPKESVGFHSDQLTYLGPYPTIASLSLGKYLKPHNAHNNIDEKVRRESFV